MGNWEYNPTYMGYDSTFDWLGAYLETIVGHKNASQIILRCLFCRFRFVTEWLQFLLGASDFLDTKSVDLHRYILELETLNINSPSVNSVVLKEVTSRIAESSSI